MAIYKRKLTLIGMALFLSLVVLAGVVGCKAAQDKKRETMVPMVASLTHSWGSVTEQATYIKSKATVKNPYPFAILLKTIEYQVLLGDTLLVDATITKNIELPAGADTEVSFEVGLGNSGLSQWWVTHITNKENTTFVYKGNMVFDLTAMEYKYPFKRTYEIKTNLLGQ